MKDIKFDFDDILIKPSILSDIESRFSGVDIYDERSMLPLMTAPMLDVINDDNSQTFINNHIYTIIPRGHGLPVTESTPFKYLSYSLQEFEEEYIATRYKLSETDNFYVLIDIANGHQRRLLEMVKKAKIFYGDRLTLMIGNIANPKTFVELSLAGADYVRLGIGNGCFVSGTQVKTSSGLKNIEDVNTTDKVLTHNGKYEDVILTHEYDYMHDMFCVNGDISSGNHEYYVVDIKNVDKITEYNYQDFAYWCTAEDLDEKTQMIIELQD